MAVELINGDMNSGRDPLKTNFGEGRKKTFKKQETFLNYGQEDQMVKTYTKLSHYKSYPLMKPFTGNFRLQTETDVCLHHVVLFHSNLRHPTSHLLLEAFLETQVYVQGHFSSACRCGLLESMLGPVLLTSPVTPIHIALEVISSFQ